MEDRNRPILPTAEQLEAILSRKRHRVSFGQIMKNVFYVLFGIVAVGVLLACLVFPVFKVYGDAMAPTVREGEIVVALKGQNYDCGDMVALNYNNKPLVKRVIAKEGQKVMMDDAGNVYVDDMLLEEPYLSEKALGDATVDFPYTVPGYKYFVLGDNRAGSMDSRNAAIGGIDSEQIVGRIVFRLWPLNRFGVLEDETKE